MIRHSAGVTVCSLVSATAAIGCRPETPRAVDMCVAEGLGACVALDDGRVSCLTSPMGGFSVDLGATSVECFNDGVLCVELSDGEAQCWSLWGYSPPDGPESIQPDEGAGPFTKFHYDWYRGCGVRESGRLSCWGSDTYDLDVHVLQPVLDVAMTRACNVYIDPEGVIHARKGESTACGTTYDSRGVPLGPTASDFLTTSLNQTPKGTDWKSVSGGAYHACALDDAGRVTCWGDWAWDEVTPVDSAFTQLASTYYATCGVTMEGTIECWEQAWEGQQYSDGDSIFLVDPPLNWYNWIATDVPFTDGWVQVGLTTDYGCGLDIAGQIRCFGAFPPGGTLETALENPLDEPPCVPDSYFGTVCP